MGNNTSNKNKNSSKVRVSALGGNFVCINSVISLAVDDIAGQVYVLRLITTGCVITEWGYDRLLVFSNEGEYIYSHKIIYNFKAKAFGSPRNGFQFDHHGIALHNNFIYITNRTTKTISIFTKSAELISIIQMPHRSTVYTSNYHYAYGIGLVREKRGSTRLDVDDDGLFMCYYNTILSLMHGMKPVCYQIVKDSEGQTLDINIHMDKLHVLSKHFYTHAISVMTKDGICLNVFIQRENTVASLTFTIDKSGVYYVSDGVYVRIWDCGDEEIIYTDENGRNRGIERGIKFDSRGRLVMFRNLDSYFKLEFFTSISNKN